MSPSDNMPQEHTPASSFGPVHVLPPSTSHSHTIILLHGRGSTGPEFAEELFESHLSSPSGPRRTLWDALPGWRWVFPSSRTVWSATFEEDMPAWFTADATAAQDLQVDDIRASVEHVGAVVDDEVARLGGRADRLVLGGISQGGAVALWALLARRHAATQRLGAFVGLSTWLPLADEIRRVLVPGSGLPVEVPHSGDSVASIMAPLKDALNQQQPGHESPFLGTPVFIGHGSDDAYVDFELGRQVANLLSSLGLSVEWRDYVGAEQEGHWVKAPEELDDIHGFLVRTM